MKIFYVVLRHTVNITTPLFNILQTYFRQDRFNRATTEIRRAMNRPAGGANTQQQSLPRDYQRGGRYQPPPPPPPPTTRPPSPPKVNDFIFIVKAFLIVT